MANECGVTTGNDTGNRIPYVPSYDPGDPGALEFKGHDGIAVWETQAGAKRIVNVGLYSAPSASISNDGGTLEVGATSGTITWTINSADGSSQIQTRTLDPDEGITGTTGQFQFNKSGITLTSAGITSVYTLTVDDQVGDPVVKTSGVSFQFLVYQGYSGSDTLDETAIKALTNKSPSASVLSLYGGAKTYNVPAPNQYIYWVFATGGATISAAELSGLPLPLQPQGAAVQVTNQYSIAQNYTVIRTANKFGAGPLTITLS